MDDLLVLILWTFFGDSFTSYTIIYIELTQWHTHFTFRCNWSGF